MAANSSEPPTEMSLVYAASPLACKHQRSRRAAIRQKIEAAVDYQLQPFTSGSRLAGCNAQGKDKDQAVLIMQAAADRTKLT